MHLAYLIVPAIILAIASFVTGLAPIGIALLVVAAGLAAYQARKGAPSAARAQRAEARSPADPLPPAHEGQKHMTPEDIPTPR